MKVVAVRKNSTGSISEYKLDNGQIIDRNEAVNLVASGKLDGYNVTTAKNGEKAIRTIPDDTMSNNLSDLPTF